MTDETHRKRGFNPGNAGLAGVRVSAGAGKGQQHPLGFDI